MRRSGSGAFVLALVGVPAALPGQSALLSAVEGSAPAPVVEPTAGVFPAGVAGLWSDPTSSPRVTGAFFGVYQASRASFRIYHAAVAFRWGPRWSVAYGQSEIGNLFDTSLTNIDPGLASLQARALWGSLDGTVSWRRLSGSLGIGLAGDDNVGDVQSSTTARVYLRVSPLRGVSIGVHTARAIGGSVPNTHRGRSNLDVLVTRRGAFLGVSMAAAVSRGSFWRYAETNGGVALAALVTVASRLELGAGAGRYTTTFGATSVEWYRSAAAALYLRGIRVGVRYTGTELGAGSGYGISIGYESERP